MLPRSLTFVGFLAAPFAAQTLYVDGSAPVGGSGSSWSSPLRDLQTALGLARSNPTISAVWVARGRYLAAPAFGDPTLSFDVPGGVTLFGGFAGHETSPDQRDIAANATILSGDLAGNDGPGFTNRFDNSHRVLVGSGASLTLDGLTISGGRTSSATRACSTATATGSCAWTSELTSSVRCT